MPQKKNKTNKRKNQYFLFQLDVSSSIIPGEKMYRFVGRFDSKEAAEKEMRVKNFHEFVSDKEGYLVVKGEMLENEYSHNIAYYNIVETDEKE